MKYDGPVVLAILDGVGLAPDSPGNAVSRARMPFLRHVMQNYPHLELEASGEAVGLTPGQMGNSEVGHNVMGAGKAVRQGIARINLAFETGAVFRNDAWRGAIQRALGGGTLHFAGIFSDGGVHSDINHLYKMIRRAYKDGVRQMRVHAVFDGRDVGPHTALKYVKDFEEFANQFEGADIRIADGGGRMVYVADRYKSDWEVVARGWDAMVNGEAEFYFKSVEEAFSTLERIDPNCQDQFLPPFVIVDDKEHPIGQIKRGDALIYFDFRADRAVEIAQAFLYWGFSHFNRGNYKPDDVYFVGMTEYDSDTHVPGHRLVEPVDFGKTLNRFLGRKGISQLAVSETVKYGHVTYYFNGNSYKKAPSEEFICVDSYMEPLESRPWMRSAEITDEVLARMEDFRFIRLNYPGGDMVGHTADFNATVMAMEAIDLSLARIAVEVDKLGGCLVIVADHGNAEELLDVDGSPKTAHTTNKVPCIFYDNTDNSKLYELNDGVKEPSLANIAGTMALMLGFNDYPDGWGKPLVKLK